MAEVNSALLEQYLEKKTHNMILDAGCGTGAAFHYLSQFGDVVGVDISDEALKFSRTIGIVKKSDIIDLPFRSGQFDLVVCLDVLYHRWVGDYRKALQEFFRVLKPNGVLFLREPAYNWMRGAHDKVDFTRRRFSKPEIKRMLDRAGFRVEKITYANFILFPFVLVKRLPEMIIQFGRPTSDMRPIYPALDHILFFILRLESKFLRHVSLPWGSSLITVAQKPLIDE